MGSKRRLRSSCASPAQLAGDSGVCTVGDSCIELFCIVWNLAHHNCLNFRILAHLYFSFFFQTHLIDNISISNRQDKCVCDPRKLLLKVSPIWSHQLRKQ
ncbi:hypothetical protein EFP46_02825 [Lacticaseibacillus paracasei]|nr:hypothetical protein [Lacticaseibacillus paracasei]